MFIISRRADELITPALHVTAASLKPVRNFARLFFFVGVELFGLSFQNFNLPKNTMNNVKLSRQIR